MRNGYVMIAFENMNNDRLGGLLADVADIQEGAAGYWRARYRGRDLFVITDEHHNRMRVMSAVVAEQSLQDDDLRTLLTANFDRALDAKYAIARDFLWAVFTHPLRELTDAQFLDALRQVATLADNFGQSYASTDLVFGGGDD